MSQELKVQADIKKSVIKDGGYAFKLSNRFSVGVPDLFVALPPFVPILIEVKDLGLVVDHFDRDAGVTPKQADTLARLNKAYCGHQHPYTPSRRAAGVLVAIHHNGKHRLIIGDEGRVKWDYPTFAARQVGGYYDLRPLFEEMGICQIKPM